MVTQAERRLASRTALLDAAAACLVEDGVAGFTTTEVIRRSGLSNGALYKHFPSKAELLASTVAHIFDRLRADYRDAFAGLDPVERTPLGLLQLLWRVMSDPALAAVYEVYALARTDAPLRHEIKGVVGAHVDELRTLAAEVLGGGLGVSAAWIETATDLAIFSMQGLVLNLMAVPDPHAADTLIADLDELAVIALPLARAGTRSR